MSKSSLIIREEYSEDFEEVFQLIEEAFREEEYTDQ